MWSHGLGGGVVIVAFYYVDEAWVMHGKFSVLNAHSSLVDFGSSGIFMCSTHLLCVSGANLMHGVDVLEFIRQGSSHVM